MGKLVVTEFISLDGVIEDPGGAEGFEHGGWSFKSPAPDGDQFKFEELMNSDAQLFGRLTYDAFAAAWPEMTDEAGFADKMNSMPKYVVSTTLGEAKWNNTTVISDNVAEEVANIKTKHEGDILVPGSSQLIDTLRAHGLIDEYRLMVHPVVLGSGKRLFNDGAGASDLELVESRNVGPNVLLQTYRPAAKTEE
ncbi:dihydrofolate reductase family protein [Actinokineospora sp.]|uniref:dihydrofolate reductase family protein n=1 Tax=Actinokineospora sp. TaxID=1872133 RepID=UPI003D6B8DEA